MEDILYKLQQLQLSIAVDIDAFCKKHGIHYSMYGGTLLGAVRHKGFIPWDDDLDICMSREEYEKFLLAWVRDPIPGYILQNKENTPSFTQTFTKIRKDHSTFIQYEWEKNLYHTGIFIDIFPLDRIPDGSFQRSVFWLACKLFLLYTREFVPPKASNLTKLGTRCLLFAVRGAPRAKLRSALKHYLIKNAQDHSLSVVSTSTIGGSRAILPNTLFDDYVYLPFDDSRLMSFMQWEDLLTRHFRDYRKLPPESERTWKHHPLILDFELNYEELPAERRVAGKLSDVKAD